MPVVELTNFQNAELTGCPLSSGVTVITTESSRGNINRFPELAWIKTFPWIKPKSATGQ